LAVQQAKDFLLDDSKRVAYDEKRTSDLKRKAYDLERSLQMDGKRKRMKGEFEDRLKKASTKASTSSSSTAAAGESSLARDSNRVREEDDKALWALRGESEQLRRLATLTAARRKEQAFRDAMEQGMGLEVPVDPSFATGTGAWEEEEGEEEELTRPGCGVKGRENSKKSKEKKEKKAKKKAAVFTYDYSAPSSSARPGPVPVGVGVAGGSGVGQCAASTSTSTSSPHGHLQAPPEAPGSYEVFLLKERTVLAALTLQSKTENGTEAIPA
jgi:hypothetical protein